MLRFLPLIWLFLLSAVASALERPCLVAGIEKDLAEENLLSAAVIEKNTDFVAQERLLAQELRKGSAATIHETSISLVRDYGRAGQPVEAAWTLAALGNSSLARDLLRKVEQGLQQEAVLSMQPIGEGSTGAQLVTLANGWRAVFKPELNDGPMGWASHPHHEVAAYHVERLLQLGVVPPTVLRTIDGKFGSLQYFVTSYRKESDRVPMLVQMLDYLIAQEDRRTANFLVRAGGQGVAIDNSVAFGVRGGSTRTYLLSQMPLTSELRGRLEGLTPQILQEEVGVPLEAAYRAIEHSQQRKRQDPSLKPLMATGDPQASFKAFQERIQALLQAAREAA